jgi:phage tail sheath gpL-like
MFAVNDSGLPNETMQLKAFKWYLENRNKINTSAPVAVQSYIKELKSGDFNFDLESSMSETQKEALRTIGSAEKAQRNAKMVENMLKNVQASYQRILGQSVGDLNPQTINELSASIAAQGNIHAEKTLATIDAIMQDLASIKQAFSNKIKEIEGNSKIPLMFSRLARTRTR